MGAGIQAPFGRDEELTVFSGRPAAVEDDCAASRGDRWGGPDRLARVVHACSRVRGERARDRARTPDSATCS
jgi:hypothetical protein